MYLANAANTFSGTLTVNGGAIRISAFDSSNGTMNGSFGQATTLYFDGTVLMSPNGLAPGGYCISALRTIDIGPNGFEYYAHLRQQRFFLRP